MPIKKYLIFLIILFYLPSQAQTIGYNMELQINTYTDGYQIDPSIRGLAGGGFVVCWQSEYQVQGFDIFGQMYDALGSKIGTEFLVNSSTINNQYQACVGSLSNGCFVIVWTGQFDHINGSTGIFGQLYHSNGSKFGQEFRVNTYTNSTQSTPSVSGLSDGGFLVCWQSDGQDGDKTGIFGQVYNSQGEKRGVEFQVNTQSVNWQWDPKVCALSKGRSVITWFSEDEFVGVNRHGVHARLFDNQGLALTAEILVNSSQNSISEFPDICSLSNGGFVICWKGWELNQWEDSFGIFIQVFDSSATKIGEKFLVNSDTDYLSDGNYPSICGLSNGGFVVCGECRDQNNDGFEIYAQIYNQNALKIGNEFRVNTYTNASQHKPSISPLSDGGFAISWQSMYQDGDLYGIYGKYFLGTPIQHSLQPFSPIAPANEAVLTTTKVDFIWQKASSVHVNFPWELNYMLYLDLTEDFNNADIYSDIYDSIFSVNNLIPGQTYFWKVLAKTYEGDSLWSSETFKFDIRPTTDIKEDPVLKPETFKVYLNFPNPFNSQTIIRYNLPTDHPSYRVIIQIYDVRGRLVLNLKNVQQQPGMHQLTWDGRNSVGEVVPSGVYFLILKAGYLKATQKMLFVK